MTDSAQPPLPIVVLISGRGSNLQAIIDGMANGDLPITVRAVISNRAGAEGLQHAACAGIATDVVAHTDYPDRTAFDQALQSRIDSYQPALVILAGFMRILTPAFVHHYYGRMLNIHPSLLPRFPGLDTHRRALAAGVSEHGASVHFVTEETDGGPVFLQARVPVHNMDTPDSLARRVLEQEHRIYPLAIRWFAEGRIFLNDRGQIVYDGQPLITPKILLPDTDTPC